MRKRPRRTSHRRWRVFVALALLSAPASSLAEEPAPSAPAPEPAKKACDDGRRTMGRLPANIGRGFVGVFSRDNLWPFVGGAAATGVAAGFDRQVRDSVADPGSSFGKDLSTVGGVPAAISVAGLFVGGRFAHGTRFRAMTYDMADAAVVNAAYTGALKLATHRERPNGSNNLSFPSGHASNAFTLATVVELHYGWKLGAPLYVLAGVISYARLVQDVHYLSDVVAGATLGYIVGRSVVRVNGRPLDSVRQATWSVSPIATRRERGMLVAVTF
jgi:membrane-associated phospholipid phosphatase